MSPAGTAAVAGRALPPARARHHCPCPGTSKTPDLLQYAQEQLKAKNDELARYCFAKATILRDILEFAEFEDMEAIAVERFH